MPTHASEPRLDRKTKTALIVFLIGVIASVAGLATWSAFSSTTSNSGNQFQTGSVTLTDNDSGTAMFNMTSARPGDTVSKCITVSYTGTLTSNVRLYGAATAGNGLDSYLDLKVTRGTFSGATPANMACTDGGGSSFVADSVTYSGGNGAGASGVMFNARMNLYPTTWTAGIVDAPGGTAEAWTNPESHVYRFEVTVANDNAAANKTHTQTFTWEAQDA
ncbi:MAG TPA: TasA family protein [Solirubrobacteraceae bacterium]|jgi:predicted ribosomally synthesized peptide with SipW-like signal peptide|nr:TasA family protein [Solirubrobacteraceae bacterium]